MGGSHTDDDLLRELYAQHGAALQRYLLPLTGGDRGRAEDLVQETLLRAWQHPEALDPARGPARAWLFTVARHLAVDAGRARRSRPGEVSDSALAVTPAALDEIDRAVQSWAVAEALADLGEDHRRVLIEIYFRARSVAETARALRIPVGTVKSRTYYALRELRLVCEERGLLP